MKIKYIKLKKTAQPIAFALLASFIFAGCTKDDAPELGELPDKSEIEFSVEQLYDIDPGGNTVVLKNMTPETISAWDYETGISRRQIDTVQYAFAGEYTISLSVVTGAGIVEMDPITITVTENNFLYVEDPLWDALTGGPGNEKTWRLDLNAEAEVVYFDGPLFFYGTENGWLGECTSEEDGADCWNWNPDYAGNSWIMPAGDYGTMTFSLISAPIVTVNHLMIPDRGTETGTFTLDPDAKTLTMNNATPLHDESRDACVDNWGDIQLFSLTEETMQLGVMRRQDCEGSAYLVYNYIAE